MKLSLSTFNGTTITTYAAGIPGGPYAIKASPISVTRVNYSVAYAGKAFQPVEFTINFVLRNSSINADIEAIGKIFNPKDSTLRNLVALDTADSNTSYYLECTPIEFPEVKGKFMSVKMWTPDPEWKKSTASTKTVSVLAAGTTNDTVVNGGNVDTYPSIAITPTATGGASSYRRHVIVYNRAGANISLVRYPLDLTSGGFDTAALVGDVTVSNQINVGGGITAIATTWAIDTSVGGGLATGGGVFYVDTEQCSYTSISGGSVIGVTRGINGTTAATHADNAVMKRSLIQADGDDMGLIDNGTIQNRWLGSMNSANTKVWGVFDFAPQQNLVLQTALNSSNDTAIVFTNTAANITAIKALPNSGLVYIDTECIAYTAKNVATRTLTIANAGRGAKDTTAATHAAASTVRWIQHDIIITYGNLNATTPVIDDTHKPCFSLANSTNLNWRWDSADSVFMDESGLRSGGWKPTRAAGKFSDWYTGDQGTYGTDPATNMGAEINSFLDVIYKSEKATMYWTFNNPCGITTLSSLGEKYKGLTNTTWPITRLEASLLGTTTWVTEWTETTPGSATTWTAWTRASETLLSGAKYIRFVTSGAVQALASNTAKFEVNLGTSGSMGAIFTTNNVPSVTLGSQATNAEINVTLSNTTTGDSITLSFPLAANTTLTLDTENRQMSYANVLLAPPELSSVRQEWFRLQPGNNAVSYVDSTTGAVTVVFTYRDRKNM